jgi:hypothetical protein
MKTIGAAERKMVMAVVNRMDLTGDRSDDNGSLMFEIHRECNRISALYSLPTSDVISASLYGAILSSGDTP